MVNDMVIEMLDYNFFCFFLFLGQVETLLCPFMGCWHSEHFLGILDAALCSLPVSGSWISAGVVGGTFSVIFLLLCIFFWTAVDLDSFSSIVFIGDGVISLSLSEAPFNSSLVDVRNVWKNVFHIIKVLGHSNIPHNCFTIFKFGIWNFHLSSITCFLSTFSMQIEVKMHCCKNMPAIHSSIYEYAITLGAKWFNTKWKPSRQLVWAIRGRLAWCP